MGIETVRIQYESNRPTGTLGIMMCMDVSAWIFDHRLVLSLKTFFPYFTGTTGAIRNTASSEIYIENTFNGVGLIRTIIFSAETRSPSMTKFPPIPPLDCSENSFTAT